MWRRRHKKLKDLKPALPVVTLAFTLAKMKAQTAGKTLSDVVPQAFVHVSCCSSRSTNKDN